MNQLKGIFLSLLLISIPVLADVETTSSVRGTVNVAGATVEITNQATGQSKTVTANESGSFSASFLKVGGPYTITASATGYNRESVDGLFLILNETSNVAITLVSVSDIEEVVTTAARSGSIKIGTGTSLDRTAMDGVPTINRSVADLAKLDPRVSVNSGSSRDAQISVMGQNNRFNDFSIDGISFNDPFGLNANGFGSMRNPISLDFVDQLSVDVTPFDVSRGNATGGSIAVVTKSGTNEFKGTYYTTDRDESNIGDFMGQDFATFSEEITSYTFSGPIIKDKVFFFVGYEELEASSPVLFGTKDSGALNPAETVTTAMANEIAQIARDVYGYEPGEINNVSYPETHEEYTAKIDWYINDFHRAVVNVSHSEDLYPRKYNRGSTVFSNNYYKKPPEIDRKSITIFSDWTDRLRTKLKVTNYEMYEDDSSYGDDVLFPEARIDVGGDSVYLGGDRYRGANLIDTTSDYITFKVDYDLGDHIITAGIESVEEEKYNLFIARYNGEIVFNSIEEFRNGEWNYLRFHTPISGNENVSDAAAGFEVEKTTFYIQDKWYVNDDLTLIYGLRYDQRETPTQPRLNPAFLERNGVPNNSKFDFDLLQPRFSFNMNVTDEVSGMFDGAFDYVVDATLRGGYGLFLGRIPPVWYGNAYSRSGGATDYNRGNYCDDRNEDRGSGCVTSSFYNAIGDMPAAAVANPRFFWLGPTSNYQVRGAYFGDAQGTDPNFEAPSSYRANLALDLVTQNGYEITFEYNKDDVKQSAFYRDLSIERTGQLADGRGTYDINGDYWLTNDSGGGAEAFSWSVKKDFGGLKTMLAYSTVEATDVYGLTSTQAESSYNYMPRFDGENLSARPSNFAIDEKWIASLDYTAQIFGNNDTRFSLIYISKSGERFSVTYDNGYDGLGGANYGGYDLAYIPTGAADPKVNFASATVAADVMTHINNTGLSNYKGTYAPRNAFTGPGYRRLDLRVTQDINVWNDHKLIVYLDVLNLLNLLDDKKGHVKEYSYNVSGQILTDGYDGQGRVNIIGVNPDDGLQTLNYNGQSVWQVNLGFKYSF